MTTTERTCATCRHWDPEYAVVITRASGGVLVVGKPEALEDEDIRPEERVEPGYLGRCRAPGLRENELPAPGGAVVVDGEGYLAVLMTTREYGCKLFAPAVGRSA